MIEEDFTMEIAGITELQKTLHEFGFKKVEGWTEAPWCRNWYYQFTGVVTTVCDDIGQVWMADAEEIGTTKLPKCLRCISPAPR